MRETTSNSVKFQYPDAIGFAFNPVLIVADGQDATSITVKMESDGEETHQVSFDTFGGKAYGDVRAFIQTIFDEDLTDIDYTAESKKSPIGKRVNFTVTANKEADEVAKITFQTFFVWAALSVGEVYNGYREITYFKGFPFTFDIYHYGNTGAVLISNDGVATSLVSLNDQGVYNIKIPKDTAKRYYDIYDFKGTLDSTTFDDKFDLTFRSIGSGVYSKKIRINVSDGCEDGVYLRWINRHGHICYWLFEKGAEKFNIEEKGEFMRNNLLSWNQEYGYSGSAGRRMSYTRQDSFALCAPLVTRETWDFLLDIATSPIVDMYTGLDTDDKPTWRSVTLQAGSYTKEMRTPLQDFVINVSLSETPTQRL